MKTVSSLDDLSVDELVRIRQQLQKRFGIGKRGNIIEVAFGLAEENGQVDFSRPNAVCFYVRHKRRPRAKVDRIPESIELRLKRDRYFVLVRLLTDVILLGTRQVQPTGVPLFHQQGPGWATTGAVIAWKLHHQAGLNWGLLTVGHIFANVADLPQREPRVQIGVVPTASAGFTGMITHPTTGSIAGTLLARGEVGNRDGVDASIVQVDRASLVRANLIPEDVATVGKRIRSARALQSDRGKLGFTFPENVRLAIRVLRFLPVSEMVPALGTLYFVIEAESAPLVFQGGRSGSLWAVARQAACLQHGGLPPQFSRGWGQALELVLEWCTSQIAQIHQLSPDKVDLRLIRVI